MRCLERNKQSFWYSVYTGKTAKIDSNGNKTGEKVPSYSLPVEMKACIQAAARNSIAGMEPFGILQQYDKMIVTDWMDCPIDENSVLYVDCGKPQLNQAKTDVITPYDYIVVRVIKSLNSVSIMISKVKQTK